MKVKSIKPYYENFLIGFEGHSKDKELYINEENLLRLVNSLNQKVTFNKKRTRTWVVVA